MKLKCPACVKHIAGAVFVLVVLLLSLEAGLRLHRRGGSQEFDSADHSPLLVASCQTFHRLKPLVQVETTNPDTGENVSLRTNSLGLRGGEVRVPRPRDVYRVLVLGDESTLAPETAEDATFCRRLQQRLQQRTRRRVEVLNAGVPGYCPLLSYLQLKHSLIGLQPDLVVLNFDMTDVADDHRCRRFLQVGADGEPLLCRHPQCEAGARKQSAERSRREILLLAWLKRQLGRMSTSGSSPNETDDISSPLGRYAWIRDDAPDWTVSIRQTFDPIATLNRLTDRSGARLIVSAVPVPWQVAAGAGNARSLREAAGVPPDTVYRNDRPFALLGGYLQKHGIRFCNPVPAFRRSPHPESMFLQRAPRFSPQGHDLFARELVRTIVSAVPELGGYPAAPSGGSVPAFSASHRRR